MRKHKRAVNNKREKQNFDTMKVTLTCSWKVKTKRSKYETDTSILRDYQLKFIYFIIVIFVEVKGKTIRFGT